MKLQRLISILTALLRKERISATVLASMFDVSVRTIYRDVQALEQAGIPIVTHTGINGGISIIEQYKIDKKLFTNEDISTLLTSLYSVSGSMPDAKLNQTLEKIKGLIPDEHSREIKLASKQLHIDLTAWSDNPCVTDALIYMRDALMKNKLLDFKYTARHGETTKRIVEPHQLVLKENNWYLKAFCLERQDFRIFKLRRMKEIIVLSQSFEPREFETEMTDFKDWKNDERVMVELIVDGSLEESAHDYCRDEYIEKLSNGKLHIRMPFVESEVGYGTLLSMGHKCEVIAPEHVREELIKRISKMEVVYK